MAIHASDRQHDTKLDSGLSDAHFKRQSSLDKHQLAHNGPRIVVITGTGRRLVGADVKLITVSASAD
jgi:hypothetical protein